MHSHNGSIDFGTWTVKDPDGRLTVSTRRVSWTHADRMLHRQVRLELTEGGVADFRHCLGVRISEAQAVSPEHCGLLRLWECRNDWAGRIWVYARHDVGSPDNWTVHFEQVDGKAPAWEWHGSSRLALGVTYRIAIERKDTHCRLIVSSPRSVDELLEDSRQLRCAATTYREIWVCSTLRTPFNKENWSSGFIEDLYVD